MRLKIWRARHEARAMSKHSTDRNTTFHATVKGWTPRVGSYKNGKRVMQ